MKRKLTIISLAAALTLSAEINSPFADGCLQRGIVLLRNDFPQGAIDQFDIARHSSPTPTQDADIAWGKAIATFAKETSTAHAAFSRNISKPTRPRPRL